MTHKNELDGFYVGETVYTGYESPCTVTIKKFMIVCNGNDRYTNFAITDNGCCKVGDYNCRKCKFLVSIKPYKSYYCDGTKIYSGTVGCRCSAYLDEQIYKKD